MINKQKNQEDKVGKKKKKSGRKKKNKLVFVITHAYNIHPRTTTWEPKFKKSYLYSRRWSPSPGHRRLRHSEECGGGVGSCYIYIYNMVASVAPNVYLICSLPRVPLQRVLILK